MGLTPKDTTAGADGVPHAPVEPWRWGVVWLMFLATMINYMDRQTLGATAEYVKQEFRLSEEGYGWVEFWFGIAFGLFQFPAGFLADRVNLRWLYAGALLLWSAAGFLTGMADSVLMLMACRVVLGIGEAFNWPCAVGIVRRLIPLEARSLANGIFHSGASLGAVVTPLVVLALVGADGTNWRLVFQVVGALGLGWAVLWFWCLRGERGEAISRPPAEDGADGAAPLSFGRILLLRQFWITLAVGVTVNLCWHFYRIWLPRFLVVDLQFTPQDVLYVLVGFFVAADLGSLAAGYLTRRLTQAGLSVERSRKVVMLATALLCVLSTPAALLMEPWVTLPLLFVVGAGAMGGFANFFALSQEIAPRHTALCLGLFGSLSWLVIAVLQPPIGALVDRIGTFAPSLIAVGFVPLLGALLALFWPEPGRRAGQAAGTSPAAPQR
jgi:ACS family hexuronate transporter-like MFS transporter